MIYITQFHFPLLKNIHLTIPNLYKIQAVYILFDRSPLFGGARLWKMISRKRNKLRCQGKLSSRQFSPGFLFPLLDLFNHILFKYAVFLIKISLKPKKPFEILLFLNFHTHSNFDFRDSLIKASVCFCCSCYKAHLGIHLGLPSRLLLPPKSFTWCT